MSRSSTFITGLSPAMALAVVQTFSLAQSIEPSTDVVKDKNIGLALRRMLDAQVQAKQNEDLDGVLENVDRVMATKQAIHFRKVFQVFDLEYSLDGFKLLYHDDEIAVARIKQTVKRISGPPQFKDNQRDALQVFRRREGQWKIFEQVVLDKTLFESPGNQPADAPTTQPSEDRPPAGTKPTTDPNSTQPAEKLRKEQDKED